MNLPYTLNDLFFHACICPDGMFLDWVWVEGLFDHLVDGPLDAPVS